MLEAPEKKIQIFIWRLLKNIIPVRVNLANKHIVVEVICPRCNQYEESVTHAIRLCPEAKAIWDHLRFEWDINMVYSTNWFHNVIVSSNQMGFQQLAITTWTIWNGRNMDNLEWEKQSYFRRKKDKGRGGSSICEKLH